MRHALTLFSVLLLLSLVTLAAAQTVPPRDPQAVAVLVSAFKALGGNLPADSVATGNIQIVAGSRTETGTIRILTRGFDQTVEDIQTAETHRSVVYSKGLATQVDGSTAKPLQLELAVTSQSPDCPIAFIGSALNNTNVGMAYLGLESLNGTSAHHIRIWTLPPTVKGMEHLADFSAKNLWIDAATGLPVKVAYARREALGASPAIPLEISYSEYRNISGVQYPFHIEKSYNGTPWMTITINTVQFGRGLTDADFPVR
jgi:hypothetical protein